MKKIILILVVGIMSGCKSNQTLVRLSEISVGKVETEKVTDLYIRNDGFGPFLYQAWMEGIWGKNVKVHLVDSVKFRIMCNKTTPVKSTKFLISSN
jgi:P pilus assembly chaperone PapD